MSAMFCVVNIAAVQQAIFAFKHGALHIVVGKSLKGLAHYMSSSMLCLVVPSSGISACPLISLLFQLLLYL